MSNLGTRAGWCPSPLDPKCQNCDGGNGEFPVGPPSNHPKRGSTFFRTQMAFPKPFTKGGPGFATCARLSSPATRPPVGLLDGRKAPEATGVLPGGSLMKVSTGRSQPYMGADIRLFNSLHDVLGSPFLYQVLVLTQVGFIVLPFRPHMAVGQRYHFGVGAPPILVYFSVGLGYFLGERFGF